MKAAGIYISYFVIFFPLVIGFFFHISNDQEIFFYSYHYFVFLLFISFFLIILLPVWLFKKTKGKEKIIKTYLLSSFVTLSVIILIVAINYNLNNKIHEFDPWLQHPKPLPPDNNLDVSVEDFTKSGQRKKVDLLVLTLGGSTTLGRFFDVPKRYPMILEQELRKKYKEKNIKVINGSQSWYTSKHSLVNYTTYYRKLKPDIVIVMHAINDLYMSCTNSFCSLPDYKSDYSHFYGAATFAYKSRSFFSFLKSTINDIPFFGTYWFSIFSHNFRHPFNYPEEYYQSIYDYSYNYDYLIKTIINDGAQPFLIEQSSLYKIENSQEEKSKMTLIDNFYNHKTRNYPSIKSLYKAMNLFNLKSEKIAKKNNAIYIKTSQDLPSNLEIFRDEVHYTQAGVSKLGKTVSKEVLKFLDSNYAIK